MVSRKSSITNAFVNALIPVIPPTTDEIEKALGILGILPTDVRCAYCGDVSSEWDHLRPLVLHHRPTGYVSEIANLVPACGRCNSSKGNQPWRKWMLGKASHSPTTRLIADLADRILRLEAYERWRSPTRVDFEAIIGREDWERYWGMWEAVNAEMRQCQQLADSLRARVAHAIQRS
jgi:hypothetical protein